MNSLLTAILETFKNSFGSEPALLVRSPGRINLIGEHTDYNMGFVLPAAIDREMIFAISPRPDQTCRTIAYNLNREETFTTDNLTKSDEKWTYYLKGVIDQIQKLGYEINGFDLVFGGNIPVGAGVSSSAALEAGLAFALNEIFKLGIPKMTLVQLCQRAENQFVGLNCGIMDMFASLMGETDSVIRLDCRSLEYEYFPFTQEEHVLVLCDTGVKHSLGTSEYNTRRQECERGVAILQAHKPSIQSLRDVDMALLLEHEAEFDPITFKRCKYMVGEIQRVVEACKDLQANDLEAFGQKMYETHDGLQHDYAVSCEELDFLVDQTRNNSSVLGARMMGGGFGGCTINLVKKEDADQFITEMTQAYKEGLNLDLVTHKVVIKKGTSRIEVTNEQA
ncbi:galactokinase [Siphonobacter sp. SORGH_AS_1065]|uniref:galactokinase n=1 Tax=Siphonobacter sp. SORGH_AS_1065 TaxID=3041795 RepID=UPI002786F543|nr:galactokinase [Siphonobacter sp. SORGH_AS_1065]MDQ1086903.1 galactokinase [Siphonobacter sp. SORGH_AS_1065]